MCGWGMANLPRNSTPIRYLLFIMDLLFVMVVVIYCSCVVATKTPWFAQPRLYQHLTHTFHPNFIHRAAVHNANPATLLALAHTMGIV
jgi:hypothetical protein